MLRKTLFTALASACVMFGVTANAADQKPFKIGSVMPMTGALQAYGDTSLKGVELAVDEINKAGGVMGQPMENVGSDAQTRPQAGVAAANKLVNIDGVHAIVGALSSGVTIPVALSVSKKNKIPQISPASTSPVITTLKDDGYLFRTVASDAFQGVALAQVAKKQGISDIAIIYVNNDYGKGLADSFTKAFQELGGKVTHSVGYEPKQASYRAAIQKAWGDGSTPHLLLIAYVADGETVLRQSLEGAMFNKFLLSDGMKSEQLIKNLGAKNIDGAIGTAAAPPKGTPAAKHFQQAYKTKYGKLPPQPYIDTSYDAVYLLALAAEKAGTTTDGAAIRDALHKVATPPGVEILPGQWAKAVKLIKEGKDIDWTGAAGKEDFDKNGDIANSYAVWQYKDGKIVTLRVFDPTKKAK